MWETWAAGDISDARHASSPGTAYHRDVTRCRMLLRHRDGRVEETEVHGDGPITVGSFWRLPPHAADWWKVVSLRWGSEGHGVAELEPAALPAHLRRLET